MNKIDRGTRVFVTCYYESDDEWDDKYDYEIFIPNINGDFGYNRNICRMTIDEINELCHAVVNKEYEVEFRWCKLTDISFNDSFCEGDIEVKIEYPIN